MMMLMRWAPGAHPGTQSDMRRLCAAHDSNRLLPAGCYLLPATALACAGAAAAVAAGAVSADAYCLLPVACVCKVS